MSEEHVDILDHMEAARQLVCDIAAGRKDWQMEIPANPRSDTDLVLTDALRAGKAEIERLRAQLARTRKENERQRKCTIEDSIRVMNASYIGFSFEREKLALKLRSLAEAEPAVEPLLASESIARSYAEIERLRADNERLTRLAEVSEALIAQMAKALNKLVCKGECYAHSCDVGKAALAAYANYCGAR